MNLKARDVLSGHDSRFTKKVSLKIGIAHLFSLLKHLPGFNLFRQHFYPFFDIGFGQAFLFLWICSEKINLDDIGQFHHRLEAILIHKIV